MKHLPETSSEDLMRAVAGGDLDAFNEIVLRHREMVWRIAYRFLGDRHAAEDMAQEAFLRIRDAAPHYRPSAQFRTYLTRVVTRLCLDYVEKRRPDYRKELPDVADRGPTGPEQVVAKETQEIINKALESLPPGQRMAVVLRYLEGLRCGEAAEAMDVSAKAVERLLAHAREGLEPQLARLLKK